MSQLKKLEAFVDKFVRENFVNESNLQELSPELRKRASDIAMQQAKSPDDELMQSKRIAQSIAFDQHVDPEVKKEVDRVSNILSDKFKTSIIPYFNKIIERNIGTVIKITFRPESDGNRSITLVIDKNKVKYSNDLSKSSDIENLLTRLVKLVKQKEIGMGEGTIEIPTNTGKSSDPLTQAQKETIKAARKEGDSVKYVKKTEPVSEKKEEDSNEEEKEPIQDIPEEQPTSKIDDLKSQVSSIISTLDAMDDFKVNDKEDLKAKKVINKIKMKLDDVLLAMDDLTSIKTNLDEQIETKATKVAEKSSKTIAKHINKIIKDKDIADQLIRKATPQNIRKMEKKAGKQLDASQLATAIVKASLKEAYSKGDGSEVKMKTAINEEDFTKLGDGLKTLIKSFKKN